MADAIQVREDVDEGQDCFVIETEVATYYYHKEGAGFSSILDREGRDWIGYRKGDGPAGEYRGVPNMVFRGEDRGYFHPGHTGTKGSVTELVGSTTSSASLRSTSGDGKWQVEWNITAHCAQMTVLKVDPEDSTYWFLYEGTPGGRFQPEDSQWGRCTGEVGPLTEDWEADLPASAWVYFTDSERRRALFLHCAKRNAFTDMYKPMEPMTVFGFGRRLEGVDSSIVDEGAVLTVGLVESGDYEEVAAGIADVVPESQDLSD